MHQYFFTVVSNGSVTQKGESVLFVWWGFFGFKLHILVLIAVLVLSSVLDCLCGDIHRPKGIPKLKVDFSVACDLHAVLCFMLLSGIILVFFIYEKLYIEVNSSYFFHEKTLNPWRSKEVRWLGAKYFLRSI